MKNIIRWIISSVFVFVGLSAVAAFQDINPKVPIGVTVKGRQAVTQYMHKQVERIEITIGGKSVVSPEYMNRHFLFHEDLAKAGYKFDGSFGALSEAIASTSFSVDLLPVENGRYDAEMNIVYYDKGGASLMRGVAWLNVGVGKGGQFVSVVEPWVWINDKIDVVLPGAIGPQSKWLTLDYKGRSAQEFYVDRFEGESVIRNFPSSLIGDGYLSVTDSGGSIRVIDFTSGEVLSSTQVLVLMGKIGSSDVRMVNSPVDGNWMKDINFYQNEGRVYGRAPLLEVVGRGTVHDVDFSVPVWGTENRIYPVSVTVRSLPDGKESKFWTEYKLFLELGVTFQIVVDYGDQVRDWEADPSPKG